MLFNILLSYKLFSKTKFIKTPKSCCELHSVKLSVTEDFNTKFGNSNTNTMKRRNKI